MLRLLEVGFIWILGAIAAAKIFWPLFRGKKTTGVLGELKEAEDELGAAKLERKVVKLDQQAEALRRKGEKSDAAKDRGGCGCGRGVDCAHDDDGEHV